MKPPAALLAALALTAACMVPRASPSAGDALYTLTRDGVQRALSATFALSASVAGWVCEEPAPESTGRAPGAPGSDLPGPDDCNTRGAEPGSPYLKEVTT
jgi:hypothetical protein